MAETTVGAALRGGAAILREAGIDNPARETRLLLCHALSRPAADVVRDQLARIDPSRFDAMLARRAAHEPMAFILGRQGFWSLDFAVSSATLIPRPDSETIVEAALALRSPRTILDLGTGTGCLLLSVLHERSEAFGIGVDLTPDAVRLARGNAERHGLGSRAVFFCGDWAGALNGRFDLVLSNPPYIEASAIPALMPEVANHEPRRALDGGPDGLVAYRAILRVLPKLLAIDGTAVFELGMGQGPAVASIARLAGFAATFRPDLAGIDRAIVLTRERDRK